MAKEGGWLIKLHKRVHKLPTCCEGGLIKPKKGIINYNNINTDKNNLY